MKPLYDYVFVTHLPAFYKVNLYKAIAQQCRIFVIFIAKSSQIRTPDFISLSDAFDYVVVNSGSFEKRSKCKTIFQCGYLLRTLNYRKLVLGGWDLIEFWVMAFLSSSQKNALALESTLYESQPKGLRGAIKRLFLTRIKTVFASGAPHRALLEALGYQGKILTTLGVGIFEYAAKSERKHSTCQGRFLFVGRLASEKNVKRLIDVFRQLPQYSLTVVGQGPLQAQLEKECPSNVRLVGHIANADLPTYYRQHDIFVLPSTKEPWGLVVEEALYYGLPVLASRQVGCAVDWIEKYHVGKLFDAYQHHDFEEALLWMVEHYGFLVDQIKRVNFNERDKHQIQTYVEALS